MKVEAKSRQEHTVEFDGFPSCEAEFASASEWASGEGLDISVNDRPVISLTWREFDAALIVAQLARIEQ